MLHKRCWVALIYQILRIYNSYRATGGRKTAIGTNKVDPVLQKLSPEERLLIGWVEGAVAGHECKFDAKPLENLSGLYDC